MKGGVYRMLTLVVIVLYLLVYGAAFFSMLN